MGLFKVSFLILLVAVSTPLLYRQFANEKTTKFMSSYYSNYKVIDQFLRQTAGHIDSAKDYLPDTKQVKDVVDNVTKQLNTFVASKFATKENSQHASVKTTKGSTTQTTKSSTTQTTKTPESNRLTNCPGEESRHRLWTKEELAKFDGNFGPEIYLGFLGLIYNVTVNAQHYGPGAEYSVFSGRDATRAFVTGNFTHDLTDDISDLDESLYSHIESWASFYSSSYQVMGRLEGRFFDSRGCGTAELGRVYQTIEKLSQEKNQQSEQDKTLPECNSEWNGELNKGRVWCSTQSGGIERDWAGVPRMYDDGKTKRCVCLNAASASKDDLQYLHEYPGCNPSATECNLSQ